ncbi:MAG: squalene synthase HpnC [Ignavibacteriae bacterium]|nr:squalene synthase HpnC [Ignavibacteriota bacterium]
MNLVEINNQQRRKYSLDESFQYCAAVTNAHYENFPVASLFLPQEKRPYIQAIYAFSRTADDFADERVRTADSRLDALNDWENQLLQCYEGEAWNPVFIALQETVKRLNIPIEPLKDLLTAFKRDVTQNRYETFDDLLSYCRCSANPVGRLVLMIFGYRDEQLYKLSDNICTALQLTNFWQDVAVDLEKDRLYLPLEDMQRVGFTIDDWKRKSFNPTFKKLLKFQVARTKQLFYDGSELPSLVDKDLQLELKLVWFGGMSILRKIEKVGFDVFANRPKLSTPNKIGILLRGLFINNLPEYKRKRKPWDLS